MFAEVNVLYFTISLFSGLIPVYVSLSEATKVCKNTDTGNNLSQRNVMAQIRKGIYVVLWLSFNIG